MRTFKFIATLVIIIFFLWALIAHVFFNELESRETDSIYISSPAIIIDPGHGGQDGGAVGMDGICEKNINLAEALILRDVFLASGRDVIMTRDTDCDTDGQDGFHKKDDIRARVNIAVEHPTAIYLGIHMNASTSSRDKGFTAFYGTKSPLSQPLAESISAAVGKSCLSTRLRDVKASPDTVYIFKNVPNNAVLLEFGFISNPDDCALLTNADYLTAYAVAILSGVTIPQASS